MLRPRWPRLPPAPAEAEAMGKLRAESKTVGTLKADAACAEESRLSDLESHLRKREEVVEAFGELVASVAVVPEGGNGEPSAAAHSSDLDSHDQRRLRSLETFVSDNRKWVEYVEEQAERLMRDLEATKAHNDELKKALVDARKALGDVKQCREELQLYRRRCSDLEESNWVLGDNLKMAKGQPQDG